MPFASKVRVLGPARAFISALPPTAKKRPLRTANASALGAAGSIVATLALITTESGVGFSAIARAASSHEKPVSAAPPKPIDSRNRLRLCIIVIVAPHQLIRKALNE